MHASDISIQVHLGQTMNTPRRLKSFVASPSFLTVHNKLLYFAADDGAVGAELWRSDGSINGTVLFADLRVLGKKPGLAANQSSRPTSLRSLGKNLYFAADDGLGAGRELWKSDGTRKGTTLLLNINSTANRSSYLDNFAAVDNVLFFSADDKFGETASVGPRLWKSDGSAAGTTAPRRDLRFSLDSPVRVGNSIFYAASDASSGLELWKSNLDATIFERVVDLVPGTGGSDLSQFTAFGSDLLFVASDSTAGAELRRSNGTALGTSLLSDINAGPGGASISGITRLANTVYFSADDGRRGRELWKSDGTPAGTVLVKDINTTSISAVLNESSDPGNFIAAGNIMYFTANDGKSGVELWRTNGTASGTTRVLDLNVGPNGSDPQNLKVVGGRLLFTADNGKNGRELWQTDGTEKGTLMVSEQLNPGPAGSSPDDLTVLGNTLFFTAQQSLWAFDVAEIPVISLTATQSTVNEDSNSKLVFTFRRTGSVAKPLTINYNVGGTASPTSDYTGISLTQATRTIIFPAGSASVTLQVDPKAELEEFEPDETVELSLLQGSEYQIATSDPVVATILNDEPLRRVKNINSSSSKPNFGEFIAFGNRLIFAADDGKNGIEPWISDGTEIGTVMLRDIESGPGSSTPKSFAVWGNAVYFNAFDSQRGSELYKSDGSPNGTTIVHDIRSGDASSEPSGMIVFRNNLYFAANTGVNGVELYRSDGTPGGTNPIKDIQAGPASSTPRRFQAFNNLLTFVAESPDEELWRTDGTEEGTKIVKDIWSDGKSSRPNSFVTLGSGDNTTLLFNARDDNGAELWRIKADQAKQVKDLIPGNMSSDPSEMVVLDDKQVIFRARTQENGVELFSTNGEEISLLADIIPGAEGSDPSELTVVGNYVYFKAASPDKGVELWMTDGTQQGTKLVKDIVPGSRSSNLEALTAVGRSLFFTANDNVLGREVWVSDGTVSGTKIVGDISKGSTSSYPENLTAVGNTLYFTAQDGANGRALWAFDPQAMGQRLSIFPVNTRQLEGDGTQSTFTYDVIRSGDLNGSCTVSWRVAGAGSSAANAADFLANRLPAGTITFGPGESKQTLSIVVLGDLIPERDENFTVILSNPVGARVESDTASGVILSDDQPISLGIERISSEAVAEGGTYRFRITRSGNVSGVAQVTWIVNPTGKPAASASDFVNNRFPSGVVTLEPNRESTEIIFSVASDQLAEANEGFIVQLVNPLDSVISSNMSRITGMIQSAGSKVDSTNPPSVPALPPVVAPANKPQVSPLESAVRMVSTSPAKDELTGTSASEVYNIKFGYSSIANLDRIIDFELGKDKFRLASPINSQALIPSSFTIAPDNSSANTLEALVSSVFADADEKRPGMQSLAPSGAAFVTSTNRATIGTYLIVNNANSSFDRDDDLLVKLSDLIGDMGAVNQNQLFG